MCTLLKYDYYFEIILVYKKILNTGGNCSIERDARALLSLYVSVPEREISNIVSQRYQTRLHLRYSVCHWYNTVMFVLFPFYQHNRVNCVPPIFELCWHTQQPSLTFCLIGGSMHVWLVALVPPERWGEMDRNEKNMGALRH
jgi:hypothetical protein